MIMIDIMRFLFGVTAPQWAMASSFTRFLDHTQRCNTICRIPLNEWSACRRDLYLHNTQHSQQTDIHASGGIRTHNLSRRAAADLRLRPRGHWDPPLCVLLDAKLTFQILTLIDALVYCTFFLFWWYGYGQSWPQHVALNKLLVVLTAFHPL